MEQALLQFFRKHIPKLNGVLFLERKLATQRWTKLISWFFFLFNQSILTCHSLQLWWKFLRLVNGKIANNELAENSLLHLWFPGFSGDYLNGEMWLRSKMQQEHDFLGETQNFQLIATLKVCICSIEMCRHMLYWGFAQALLKVCVC